MIVYVDSEYKCHVNNDGTMESFDVDFFNDKCDMFIEGYRYIPVGCTWVRNDGVGFEGVAIIPWKNYNDLDNLQRTYERELIRQYEADLAELDAAMLEMQYQKLTGGL